jgi:hypothetical protein
LYLEETRETEERLEMGLEKYNGLVEYSLGKRSK